MSPDVTLVVLRGLVISGLMGWAVLFPVWLCTDPAPGRPWHRFWWTGE